METLETLDENIEKLTTETNNNEQKNNETNKENKISVLERYGEDLTKKEYEIIELLALHERQIFSKEHIFLKLWNEENDSDIKVVTEYIRRIRKKIYEFTDENFIETEWGSGYRWKRFDKETSK